MTAMERAYARLVARAPTCAELEAEAERALSGDWPAVRLEDVPALDVPTRRLELAPEVVRALDELARRAS